MCKKILRFISLMMVMLTITAAPFAFPVHEFTVKVGSNTHNISNCPGEKEVTMMVEIDEDGQDDRGAALKLDITGFDDEEIYWGDIEMTDTYKEITPEAYPDRSLIFDCSQGFGAGKAVGMLRGTGVDDENETTAYFTAAPAEVQAACTELLAKYSNEERRLLLV